MNLYFYPLLVFLSMAAWSAFHSWIAAPSTKERVRRIFGSQIDRYYRLVFVFAAGLTLFPILGMLILFPSQSLWVIRAPWVYLSVSIQVVSAVIVIISVIQTDPMIFVGWRQLQNPDAEEKKEMITSGLYGLVRHPQFLFSIILLWLFPYMTNLVLAFNIASTLYFLVGTFIEESKLKQHFGEKYEAYQEKVPRIIPGIKG